MPAHVVDAGGRRGTKKGKWAEGIEVSRPLCLRAPEAAAGSAVSLPMGER